ncbi:acetate--CoA ligase family protein [Desulfurococcaceae archaeon MEX13E-LK6-19]|nr:acetate--CoA ligase family protein [Desulfurococcaceae archaeon MEX13E-LK6-19]
MNPREIIAKALEENRTKLLEHEAIEIIKYYGAPVAEALLAKTPEEAGELAEKIGFPVVLKIVSPDISHKSDVGGVIVGVNSKEEAIEKARKILENVSQKAPGARVSGILVQKQAKPGLEVIVGGLRDSVFGPVVMFGLGGIFVEVLRDVSFRIAPISEEEAIEMMKEIKASKILEGYRNVPPVDKKALAKVIIAAAKLLEENPEVDSLDLNPVIAYQDGALVVDARVILKKK